MKKDEAREIAPKISNFVIEALEQFLSIPDVTTGKMEFTSSKIDKQSMCTIDIYVPSRNIEEHINTGITVDHCDILYEQLFNDLLDRFLEDENMGVGRYIEIKSMMGGSFTGMNAQNLIGSKIALNFIRKGNNFSEIKTAYNKRIKEYEEKVIEISNQSKLR